MSTRKKLLSLFCVFCVSLGYGQQNDGALRVIVMEDGSGEPLIGANVYLKQGHTFQQGVICDIDGLAHFSEVPPGKYELFASYIGFENFRDSIKIESNKLQERRVFLHGGIGLEEIVIVDQREVPCCHCDWPPPPRPRLYYRKQVGPALIPGMVMMNGRAPTFTNMKSSMQNSSFSGSAW